MRASCRLPESQGCHGGAGQYGDMENHDFAVIRPRANPNTEGSRPHHRKQRHCLVTLSRRKAPQGVLVVIHDQVVDLSQRIGPRLLFVLNSLLEGTIWHLERITAKRQNW